MRQKTKSNVALNIGTPLSAGIFKSMPSDYAEAFNKLRRDTGELMDQLMGNGNIELGNNAHSLIFKALVAAFVDGERHAKN